MPILNNDLLCHKVLSILIAKTNNQTYYIGEGNLAEWYISINDLLQIKKSDIEKLKEVMSLMKEGDEIGIITRDGSQYLYLKTRNIEAVEEQVYKKTSILSHFKKIIGI